MPPQYIPNEKEAQRFWSKVDKSGGPDACWDWTRAKDKYGYGFVRLVHYSFRAYRIAWTLTYGPIPDGLHVLHNCDNPSCCNPSHLRLGTPADNTRDMDERGRRRTRAPRGENQGSHKLTDEQVEEIRRRYAEGGITQTALGWEYGISQDNVSLIVNYRSRKLPTGYTIS